MKRIIPAALIAMFAALPVFAGEFGQNQDSPRATTSTDDDKKDGFSIFNILKDDVPAPVEQTFTVPDLDTLGNWKQIRNNNAWGTEVFLVSQDSLSVGDKDKIVRYAVGIPLKNGKAYNYVYEGLDCDSSQFRTYQYANSNDMKWAPMTRKWQKIADAGYNTYQAPLYDMFCSSRDPVSLKEMKSELGDKANASPVCQGCSGHGAIGGGPGGK